MIKVSLKFPHFFFTFIKLNFWVWHEYWSHKLNLLFFSLFPTSCYFCTHQSFPAPNQAVQEEVSIPGAFVKLSYLSTRAAGYLSMLRVLLTPPTPLSPVSPLGGLSKVHVRASVEGRLYQRWYPAGPGLVHKLVWNKTDIYGQEVWGLTYATGECRFQYNAATQLASFQRSLSPDKQL